MESELWRPAAYEGSAESRAHVTREGGVDSAKQRGPEGRAAHQCQTSDPHQQAPGGQRPHDRAA